MLVWKIFVGRGSRRKMVRWKGLYLFGVIPLLLIQDSLDEP